MTTSNTINPPVVFTQDELGWVSWIDPLPEADLTERHFAGLVDRARAKSEYFRLLVRDPEVLEARTKTDKDIFYNVADGLPRAERELGAMVVSVTNGCVYCTSVHAQRFEQLARRSDTVEQVFEDPRSAGTTERERAIARFAIAVTERPHALAPGDIAPLRAVGMSDEEVIDLLHAVAIFGWANRLMQNLGEPRPEAQEEDDVPGRAG